MTQFFCVLSSPNIARGIFSVEIKIVSTMPSKYKLNEGDSIMVCTLTTQQGLAVFTLVTTINVHKYQSHEKWEHISKWERTAAVLHDFKSENQFTLKAPWGRGGDV